jgi:hypothetical protein
MSLMVKNRFQSAPGRVSRRAAVRVEAAAWSKATTTGALKAAGEHSEPVIRPRGIIPTTIRVNFGILTLAWYYLLKNPGGKLVVEVSGSKASFITFGRTD